MTIHVHIERLVLDGLPVAPARRHLVRGAVEAELTHLLADGGLAPGLTSGAAWSSVPGGSIVLNGEDRPDHLGRQIARAVHRGLKPSSAKTAISAPQRVSVATRPPGRLLQRQCDCGTHALGGECDSCRRKRDETVQKSSIRSPRWPNRHEGRSCGAASGTWSPPVSSRTKRARPPIQAKLVIGEVGDRYEQEADRVADAVTSTPPTSTRAQGVTVQRKRRPWTRSSQTPSSGVCFRDSLPDDADLAPRSVGGAPRTGRAQSSRRSSAVISARCRFTLAGWPPRPRRP